jgi:hypothetical protein
VCGGVAHTVQQYPIRDCSTSFIHFTLRRNIMAIALDTGAQIAAIEAAAAAENAINLATLEAKVKTMGLKAAKDIVGN